MYKDIDYDEVDISVLTTNDITEDNCILSIYYYYVK